MARRWSVEVRSSRPAARSRALVVDRGGGARPRLGRRPGGASYAHRVGVRRPLRHGGRRVPDPRAQRVRRPVGRCVGARDRPRPLRCCSPPSGCCRGCAGRPRRATGARWSPRCRASCSTVAAADVLPRLVDRARSSLVALALLAESFGRQVWWLWRSRARSSVVRRARSPAPLDRPGRGCSLWVGLTLPDRVEDLSPVAFVRLPLEALVLVVLAALLPARARSVVAVGRRASCSALVTDREGPRHGLLLRAGPFLRPGHRLDVRRLAVRPARATRWARRPRSCCSPLAAVLLVALLVLTPLALRRLGAIVARHRRVVAAQRPRRSPSSGCCASVAGPASRCPRCTTRPHDGSAPFASDQRRRRTPTPRCSRVPAELAGPARVRARRRARPAAQHARPPAADRAARQGRHLRLRRELRPLGGPGLVVRARRRPVLDAGTRAAARRRLRHPQRVPHLADVRRRSAGWRTRRSSPGCGSTASSATTC